MWFVVANFAAGVAERLGLVVLDFAEKDSEWIPTTIGEEMRAELTTEYPSGPGTWRVIAILNEKTGKFLDALERIWRFADPQSFHESIEELLIYPLVKAGTEIGRIKEYYPRASDGKQKEDAEEETKLQDLSDDERTMPSTWYMIAAMEDGAISDKWGTCLTLCHLEDEEQDGWEPHFGDLVPQDHGPEFVPDGCEFRVVLVFGQESSEFLDALYSLGETFRPSYDPGSTTDDLEELLINPLVDAGMGIAALEAETVG